MGNRTDRGGIPTTGNRYQSFNGATFAYDADGNLTQKSYPSSNNRQYFWNAENQLDSAIFNGWNRTSYDYNALGNPVRIWDGDPNGRHIAKYLLWDGEALIAELDANGQRQVDYAYLPGNIDRPFAHTLGATSPTVVRYHEQDGLGQILGTSQSGSLSQSNSYDPWGTVTIQGNADSHLFWKGLFWNGDFTGLYYVRNRWYDPESGRFVNEDPAGLSGGINLYAFSSNDPINGSDPLGLCDMSAALAYALQVLAASNEVAWSHKCADLATVTTTANPRSGPEDQGVVAVAGPLSGGGGVAAGAPQSGFNSAVCNANARETLFSFGADATGVSAARGIKLLVRASRLRVTYRVDLEAWRAWHFGGSVTPAPRPSNWSYLLALWQGSGNLTVDLAFKFSDMRAVLAAHGWNLERSLAVSKMVPVLGTGLSLGETILACR